MTRPEICFSCPHHIAKDNHPSGESDFCGRSTSCAPRPLFLYPLKCAAHPDPEHQPAGRSRCSFETLKGKTLTAVEQQGNEEIVFTTSEGERYRMFHGQRCCENVTIEDVAGDLQSLVGEPLLEVEKVTHEGKNPDGVEVPEYQDSFTWTFYKLRTNKGYATIRWYGKSNGYYSESVDFERIPDTPAPCQTQYAEDIVIDIGFRPVVTFQEGRDEIFEVRDSEGRRIWFQAKKVAAQPCNPGEWRLTLAFNLEKACE